MTLHERRNASSRYLTAIAAGLAFYFGAFSAPALAYLDPASGSAVMSAIIGVFVALGIFIKTYWYRLKRMFGFGQRDRTDSDETNRG